MECGEDGGLPQHRSVPAIKSVVGTDLLCVISSEAQKNCDTDQTVGPVQRAEEGEKQGDYAEDQQENETAQENGAEAGEIRFRKVTVEGQHAKIKGCRTENQNEAQNIKNDKVGGKNDPIDPGVEKKENAGHGHGEMLDAGREEEDDGHFRYQQDDVEIGNGKDVDDHPRQVAA